MTRSGRKPAVKLRIRRIKGLITDEWAASLRCLHDATFGDDAPMADFSKGHWWIVLGPFGERVGFAGMVASRRWKVTGYLERVGILPIYRGNGMQRRLIKARERYARKLGWLHMLTDTSGGNTPSSNNLIAAGYSLYEPKVPYTGLPDTNYWRKNL